MDKSALANQLQVAADARLQSLKSVGDAAFWTYFLVILASGADQVVHYVLQHHRQAVGDLLNAGCALLLLAAAAAAGWAFVRWLQWCTWACAVDVAPIHAGSNITRARRSPHRLLEVEGFRSFPQPMDLDGTSVDLRALVPWLMLVHSLGALIALEAMEKVRTGPTHAVPFQLWLFYALHFSVVAALNCSAGCKESSLTLTAFDTTLHAGEAA